MKKIINFGSLNIDHVYTVDHFVQPGETTSAQSFELLPGGKGLNQSVALAKSGGVVHHAGKVATDGIWLIDLLENAGVQTELIDRTGTNTGTALIQVNKCGQNCIIIHHGANAEISDEYIDSTLNQFGCGDLILLQNEINSIEKIMNTAYQKGMEIAFNPSPFDDSIERLPLEKVTYFLLNEIEGFELTGETVPALIAENLLRKYPGAKIVLTLGKSGVLYRDGQQSITNGTYQVPVVDTTAAGDTFTGFFLSQVVAGCPVVEALRIASVASSIAVSKKGAAISIPTLKQVETSNLLLAD